MCRWCRTEDKAPARTGGTTRARVDNLVYGVTTGYAKTLEITGAGYITVTAGNNLHYLGTP